MRDCPGPRARPSGQERGTAHTPARTSSGEPQSPNNAAPIPPPFHTASDRAGPPRGTFASICIPSCAQLHPALGHKFVAGGGGRRGHTLRGRSLPRRRAARAPEPAVLTPPEQPRRGPACPAPRARAAFPHLPASLRRRPCLEPRFLFPRHSAAPPAPRLLNAFTFPLPEARFPIRSFLPRLECSP